MKFLFSLILGFFYLSNLTAQDIKTELKDGIIDKDYKAFSILNTDQKFEPESQEALILSSDYMTSIITFTDPDYPSPTLKDEVENALRHELISQGYAHKKSGAKMLVAYSIYNRDGIIKGDFTENDRNEVMANEEYKVKKGTLLISIIDKESGQTIWSGFNDGALANVTSSDENKIVKSVSGIMNQLRLERSY